MVGGATWIDVDTWVYFIGVDDLAAKISLIEGHGGSVIQKVEI